MIMIKMIRWWQLQVGPPLPMPKATTVCSRVMHYTYMNPVVSSYAFGWFFGSLLPVLPSAILSSAASLPSSEISEITCRLIIAKFIIFEIREAPFWNVLFPDMDIARKGGLCVKAFQDGFKHFFPTFAQGCKGLPEWFGVLFFPRLTVWQRGGSLKLFRQCPLPI